jgi:hypothetical protein
VSIENSLTPRWRLLGKVRLFLQHPSSEFPSLSHPLPDTKMGNPENPAPASKASTAIVKVKTNIQEVEAKIGQVRPPIAALAVTLEDLRRKYIDRGVNTAGEIIRVCDTLKDVLTVLGPLRFLPVAGAVIGRVVSALERLDIEGKIEKVAREIKTIFEKVRRLSYLACRHTA